VRAPRAAALFGKMFDFIRSAAFREPKFVTTHVDGSTTTLALPGKNADGNATSGKVAMKRGRQVLARPLAGGHLRGQGLSARTLCVVEAATSLRDAGMTHKTGDF
jgi:hypothetical protein